MSIMLHISKNKRSGKYDLRTYRNGKLLPAWRGSWRTDIQAYLEAELASEELARQYPHEHEIKIVFKPELGGK